MYHRSPYVCYPCDRSCIRVVIVAVPDVCNIKHILIVTNKPVSTQSIFLRYLLVYTWKMS